MVIDLQSTEYKRYTDLARSILSERQRYAYVVTFGCQQNEADSETIKGVLADMGYTVTEKQEMADIIIVNTCAIREHAESKAFSLLGRFKAQRQENPELIIGVVGCMAADSRVAEALRRDFKYVSFSLEPNRLFELPEAICKILTSGERNFQTGKDNGDLVEGLPKVRQKKHKAWVSIMYGCNNFCSYCIVPYVRGRERSRDKEAILREVKMLSKEGYKEITLLGQNVNSYHGEDQNGKERNLAYLLNKLAELDGLKRLRYTTSYPADVDDDLIECHKNLKQLMPYLHLPVQSGSDKILKAMNRRHNRTVYLDKVEKLTNANPNLKMSSDFIVGFPGETDEDFEQTLSLVNEVKYIQAFSFKYSRRAGTPAAVMPNQVEEKVKKQRLDILQTLLFDYQTKFNLSCVGKEFDVLFEQNGRHKGQLVGRTPYMQNLYAEADKTLLNKIVNVRVENATTNSLCGKVL